MNLSELTSRALKWDDLNGKYPKILKPLRLIIIDKNKGYNNYFNHRVVITDIIDNEVGFKSTMLIRYYDLDDLRIGSHLLIKSTGLSKYRGDTLIAGFIDDNIDDFFGFIEARNVFKYENPQKGNVIKHYRISKDCNYNLDYEKIYELEVIDREKLLVNINNKIYQFITPKLCINQFPSSLIIRFII